MKLVFGLVGALLFVVGCDQNGGQGNAPSVMDETTLEEKNPIEPPIGTNVIDSDYALDQRIHQRMANLFPNLPANVEFDIEQPGVVRIVGTVESEAQRQRIEQTLTEITGVEKVVNELKVGRVNDAQTDEVPPSPQIEKEVND